MGIGYRHFLAVDDPAWRPQADTIDRVEAVLRAWSLANGPATVVELSPKAQAALPETGSMPDLALSWRDMEGPAVAALAGASAYGDIDPAERYLMEITLIAGNDYRVQWSPDGFYFKLVAPPRLDGVPVRAHEDNDAKGTLYAESFPFKEGASAPVVQIQVEDHAKPHLAWETCSGFWRAALVLDFGKDLPAFTESVHCLPARDFVAAVGEALRGPIVEIGELY